MAEETLRDVIGELEHVALDAPQQPIEVDARVEADHAVAELDGVCELELALEVASRGVGPRVRMPSSAPLGRRPMCSSSVAI